MKFTTLFNPKSKWWIIMWSTFFILLISTLHFLLRNLRYQIYFDIDNYWPVSIFLPKYLVIQDYFILVSIICFIIFGLYKFASSLTILSITLYITLLIFTTNSLQGTSEGFGRPFGTADAGYVNYYNDSLGVSSTVDLLQTFTALQPTLRDHPRVHPPGALLYYYYLRQIPIPYIITLISLFIGLLSVPLFYLYLNRNFSRNTSILVTTIYGLIPGIQIYLLTSFDSVVITSFFATFYFFTKKDLNLRNYLFTLIMLFVSSFITYGVIWLLCVLALYSYFSFKSLSRFIKIVSGLLFIYLSIYFLTGFNYFASLNIATSFEGPPGFYPLVAPLSYIFTRIEDILEIIIFISFPISGLFIYQVSTNLKKLNFELPSLYALSAFLLFIFAGAYYTGETGRAASFLYPFLLISVASYIETNQPSITWQRILLFAIFFQTILMQSFGWYAW